jgi:hypothetical protein
LKALPEWISSGILEQIDQFGLEIHTAPVSISPDNIVNELSNLMEVIRFHLLFCVSEAGL